MSVGLLVIMPVIGSLIGYITNMLAIRLLFRPYRAIKMPLLPLTFQGLLPRHRQELASTIAKIIEEQLISTDDLVKGFNGSQERFAEAVKPAVKRNLLNKLPRFLPGYVKNAIGMALENIIKKEINSIIKEITRQLPDTLANELDIRSIIQTRLYNIDLSNLEKMVVGVTFHGLKHIERLGAVLGFIIGLMQALIFWFISL